MRAKKSSRAPKFPAPQQRKRQTQRVEEHDDDVWEDLVVETRKAAAIRTFQINGLVALPSVLQATVVAAGVFYVFGSVLLFCAVTLASYVLLMGYSSVTSEKDEDEMLECVTTFAHLERRFRCGTLRFTDCIHYVLYKILRAIECIKTLHRSMLDYSFTVSITRSSAYHDLLELVETKEEQTHSSTASSLGTKQRKTNTITATQKKKLKKQQRMKTMTTTYTGKITIENIVGGSQVVAVPAKETKEPGKQQLQIEQSPPASATLPLLNIPVLRAIKSAPASASKAARDLKQDLTVVLKQLKGEELLPTLASPQASLFSHSKPLTQPTSERKSVDKKELKQATKRRQSSSAFVQKSPADAAEVLQKDATAVLQVPPPQKEQQQPVTPMEDIKSTPVVHVDTQVVVADDTFVVASRSSDSTEKLEKPRRRRHSRRSRRSTATERLSAYDEFLLLEPILVASKATPSAADEDRTRYIAEAASVRSLQQTSAPFEIKSMTNPDLRLMVDEMNSMVSSMYSTLAGNWDFLASLSVVEEEKPTSPDVEAPATDVPAEECAEEDAALPEPEYEDECFGDLEYDDNYYSYHSTSTPCV